jgi:hypothetical protein
MKGFFGDLLEKFMIDENREKDKLILKKLYGYKNIDLIAEKKVKLDILFPVLDKFF